MSDPGLLLVHSRIYNPALSDADFNRFYDEEHLGDVLRWKPKFTDLALRYKNIDSESKFPYIALYPVHHCSFLTDGGHRQMADGTRQIRFMHNADIEDYVQYDAHFYRKFHTFEGQDHKGRSGEERGRTLIHVEIEPGLGMEEEFEEWYQKQHLDMLSMVAHYRRTTRYRRLDLQKPSYLVLHEYDCKPADLRNDQIALTVGTEWSKRILAKVSTYKRAVYELIQSQGETSLNL